MSATIRQAPGLMPDPMPAAGQYPGMAPQAAPQAQDPIDIIRSVLAKGADITDDDIALLGQAFLFLQLSQQTDALDLSQGQLDLQFGQLGLNQEQLEQQYDEFEFMRDQYFPWYTGDYFDFMKQQEANKVAMSNNQLGMSNNDLLMSGNQLLISNDDVTKSKNYALASGYQTDQAKYGADAAKYQLLAQLGMVNLPKAPMAPEINSTSRGTYGY